MEMPKLRGRSSQTREASRPREARQILACRNYRPWYLPCSMITTVRSWQGRRGRELRSALAKARARDLIPNGRGLPSFLSFDGEAQHL